MLLFGKSNQLLGINARNLLYIKPYNPKKAIKLADDKIKTKQFLSARDVPVPKLFGMIKDASELEKFDFASLPSSFVVKPNHGFGGEGIIPITNRRENYWITAGGKKVGENELRDHIHDIIDGRFSISNVSDTAFFEQFIISHDSIGQYSYDGLPDIRVVVHNLIPVMAMLRLPTKESKGKANLHQGAIGAGIDIAKGTITNLVKKNSIIEELPENMGDIRGLKIPYWDEILHIASKIQLITNLGYLAADIAIDKNSGPVLLEINARAGLNVQIANLAPLRKRLERIEGVKVTSPTKGVRIAKDMFGNMVEKEIASLSGKEVIGGEEEIEIIQKSGTIRLMAKIDTGQDRTVIDELTANKLGLLDSEDYDDEKSILKLKLSIQEKRIQTIVDVEKISNPKYEIILGKRDLKDFLIDPSIERNEEKKVNLKLKESEVKASENQKKSLNFFEADQKLIQIDNKIKLLYHLRPINLESEKQKFFENFKQNPQFEYPELKFNPLDLVDELEKIQTDSSPLGKLFARKKHEVGLKIALLESIDEDEFSEISTELFGRPSEEDINFCSQILKNYTEEKNVTTEFLSSEEAKNRFEKIFEEYELDSWKVTLRESMVSDCIAGKNNRLFIRKDAKFSEKRIQSLIVHEIETHIITAENGKNQPYEIFNRGLADYLETQEGMAMYNVEKQTNTAFTSNHKAHAHVLAINEALKGSFVDAFEKILSFGLPMEQAFRSALKAKRGFCDTSKKGAFTKDYIYYRGYHKVKNFIEEGNKLADLYLGKFSLDDLKLIKEIPSIQEAKILPKWLQ